MADLAAGTTVLGNDTPPTVTDTEAGSYTCTNTTFGVGTTGGTYADCGVAFVAPTTGRVKIDHSGWQSNSAANFTMTAPVVRQGSTVGSGTVVLAASDDNTVAVAGGGAQYRNGTSILVTGLTPGSAYNVRIEHRVSGGTGTIQRRNVIVTPCT